MTHEPSPSPTQALLDALATTRATRTARLDYVPLPARLDLSDIAESRGHSTAARGLRAVHAIVDRLLVRYADPPPALAGVIDFARQRSVYNVDGDWHLTTPGAEYLRRPGGWQLVTRPDARLDDHEPFWLLALIDGVTEVHGHEEAYVGPVRSTRVRAFTSVTRAAAAGHRELHTAHVTDGDPERLELDVWLDAQALIERVQLTLPSGARSLEMWDFGTPIPIELPAAGELTGDG